jgi:hypothetical protein
VHLDLLSIAIKITAYAAALATLTRIVIVRMSGRRRFGIGCIVMHGPGVSWARQLTITIDLYSQVTDTMAGSA